MKIVCVILDFHYCVHNNQHFWPLCCAFNLSINCINRLSYKHSLLCYMMLVYIFYTFHLGSVHHISTIYRYFVR